MKYLMNYITTRTRRLNSLLQGFYVSAKRAQLPHEAVNILTLVENIIKEVPAVIS